MLKPETNGPIASFCMFFWMFFHLQRHVICYFPRFYIRYVEIAGRYRFSANLILFLAAMSAATSYHFSLDVRLRSSQISTTCNCESLLSPRSFKIFKRNLCFCVSVRWENLRESQLMCICLTPKSLPNDRIAMFDEALWQSLCHDCHVVAKKDGFFGGFLPYICKDKQA